MSITPTIYRWVQRYAPEMENGASGTGVTLPIFARGTWINLREGQWPLGVSVPGRRQPGPHCRFLSSSRRNSKAAYRFLGKILNNVKKWQIPRFITG